MSDVGADAYAQIPYGLLDKETDPNAANVLLCVGTELLAGVLASGEDVLVRVPKSAPARFLPLTEGAVLRAFKDSRGKSHKEKTLSPDYEMWEEVMELCKRADKEEDKAIRAWAGYKEDADDAPRREETESGDPVRAETPRARPDDSTAATSPSPSPAAANPIQSRFDEKKAKVKALEAERIKDKATIAEQSKTIAEQSKTIAELEKQVRENSQKAAWFDDFMEEESEEQESEEQERAAKRARTE